MALKSSPDAPWNNSSEKKYPSYMGYDESFFFFRPFLEQLGVENGSGRDAVHGVVNDRWTVVHLRAFRSVPPSDFCRGSYQKISSVWLHHWNAESCGKAFGRALTQAKIVNYCDQLWPIYPLHFAGVLAECFAWWRTSLTLRLLACGRAWMVSVTDGILRVLLFLLF